MSWQKLLKFCYTAVLLNKTARYFYSQCFIPQASPAFIKIKIGPVTFCFNCAAASRLPGIVQALISSLQYV